MFFRNLERRIKALEVKIRRREIAENCAVGKHEWEMRGMSDGKPWVCCIHCWSQPQ